LGSLTTFTQCDAALAEQWLGSAPLGIRRGRVEACLAASVCLPYSRWLSHQEPKWSRHAKSSHLVRRASTLQLQPRRDDRSPSLLLIARLRQRALTPSRGWRCRACSGSNLKPRVRSSHVQQVNNVTFVPSPSVSGVRRIRSVCICLSWPGSAFTPWSDSRPNRNLTIKAQAEVP
jgi:hypothetical protein